MSSTTTAPAPSFAPLPLLRSLLPSLPVSEIAQLAYVASALHDALLSRELTVELAQLGGELRDDARARKGGVKADWMARVVPSSEESDEAGEGSGKGEEKRQRDDDQEKKMLQPTLLSDPDSTAEMSQRVDETAERVYGEGMDLARERLKAVVSGRVGMEVELRIGGAILAAQDQDDDEQEEEEEDPATRVMRALVQGCADAGVDMDELGSGMPLPNSSTMESTDKEEEHRLRNGVEGLTV